MVANSHESYYMEMIAQIITVGISTLADNFYLTKARGNSRVLSLNQASHSHYVIAQQNNEDLEIQNRMILLAGFFNILLLNRAGNYMLAHGEQHFLINLISSQTVIEGIPSSMHMMIKTVSNKSPFLYFKPLL